MSILIKGLDMPKKHHMNCYYIDDDGRVLDVSRKNVVGEAVQYIEPQRKTGKWEIQVEQPNTFSPGGNPVYACSECGWVYGVPLDIEPEYNYCPNCGARMESEEE